MQDLPESKGQSLSRRSVLSFVSAFGAAAPFGIFRPAHALTPLPHIRDASLICRIAAGNEAVQGPPRKLALAWDAGSVCTSAAPVAKERGIYAKCNLDVDFVNFGGITEQLLEAIATGKADAGSGWHCVG